MATGQTGIMIEGWGIAVDAVVADFIAGAAEWLVLEGSKDADIVLVEGQGSLNHPGYSGVTCGLLHGSCPDALILCHQATREVHRRLPRGGVAQDPAARASTSGCTSRSPAFVHPTRTIGIALNTYDLDDAEARAACEAASPGNRPAVHRPGALRSGAAGRCGAAGARRDYLAARRVRPGGDNRA